MRFECPRSLCWSHRLEYPYKTRWPWLATWIFHLVRVVLSIHSGIAPCHVLLGTPTLLFIENGTTSHIRLSLREHAIYDMCVDVDPWSLCWYGIVTCLPYVNSLTLLYFVLCCDTLRCPVIFCNIYLVILCDNLGYSGLHDDCMRTWLTCVCALLY